MKNEDDANENPSHRADECDAVVFDDDFRLHHRFICRNPEALHADPAGDEYRRFGTSALQSNVVRCDSYPHGARIGWQSNRRPGHYESR